MRVEANGHQFEQLKMATSRTSVYNNLMSIVLNVHPGVTIVHPGEQVLSFGLSSDLLTPNTSTTNTKYQSF